MTARKSQATSSMKSGWVRPGIGPETHTRLLVDATIEAVAEIAAAVALGKALGSESDEKEKRKTNRVRGAVQDVQNQTDVVSVKKEGDSFAR
jgi:hypothetical protein